MRKIHGVAAVPITACLLFAMVGCTNTVGAAPAASHTTAAPASTTSTTSATSGGGSSSAATPTTSTPTPTQAPFPGIWDITTWAQYRATQAAVLQGHQPWLLDPSMVVSAWAHQWQPVPPVQQVSANVFQVVKPGTKVTYTIHGTVPDPKSEAPIWVITSIAHD